MYTGLPMTGFSTMVYAAVGVGVTVVGAVIRFLSR